MRDAKYFFLLLLISLLPCIYIFLTSSLVHTHDGFVHLPRIAAYFKALHDGQIPVRWAGDLNYGYGLPLFNFMYQLPYMVASVFLYLGLSLVNSFKITLLLSYILSGIFMFAFAKAFFQDSKKAFLVTIFYQFAPFRLVELFIRGSLGEVYTYAFFPLVLYGVVKVFQHIRFSNVFLIAFAGFFLIISHNALSLVFFLVAFLFVLIFSPSRKASIAAILALGYSLLLSSFYWAPAILEHKYTYGDLFMKEMYSSHFVPLPYFLIPNVLNSKQFLVGGISVQFGMVHTMAIIISLVLLFRKRDKDIVIKKILIFSLVLIILVIFFTQAVSTFLWEHISLLRQFQFPWRLLGVSSFASSLLAISFFYHPFFKKHGIYNFIIILTIISTVYYWRGPLGFDKIGKTQEEYYWNFPLNTTYFGETDLIWSAGPAHAYPKSRIETIGGKAQVTHFTKNSYRQHFTVSAQTPATLVNHTQYFPGWRIYIDGKPVEISFQDPSWRGEMIFSVSPGKHTGEAIFKESKLRFMCDMITVFSFAFLVLSFVFFRKIKI